MSVRLTAFIIVAAALAVGVAHRSAKPPEGSERGAINDAQGRSRAELDVVNTLLRLRPLAGKEPPEPPVLHIDVVVDTTGGKNRLVYAISEEHGYYVESFRVLFQYRDEAHRTRENTPLAVTHHIENYVRANDSLVSCIELNPAELEPVGGDIGTSENWEATIVSHGRARLENPDPLPPLSHADTCR